MKRCLDVLVALSALLLLSPLMGLIAIAVKVTSPGPVLFRGIRSGRFGTPFAIYKFRSMAVGSEKRGLSTGRNDPRVTRVGAVLRRYKLDELPQLLNVLKGDMSLVGPRPEMPEYTRLYGENEQIILAVRPGLTDYASLHFIRLDEVLGDQEPDRVYEERVRPIKNALRVHYVKTRSLCTDIRLIGATVAAVLTGSRYRRQVPGVTVELQ